MREREELATTARSLAAPRRWVRRLAGLAALVGLATVGTHAWYVFGGSNCHAVIPGQVYRCAQLSGSGLETVIRRHGIRTVINLRGFCAPQDWYLEECRAIHRLDVAMEDVSMSAGRFPSTRELRYLVEVLDRSEYPVVFHCKQGADRTGLASTLSLLLRSDVGLEEARQQLSIRYGHVAIGRPANLDRFLDLYVRWLRAEGRGHSPAALRDWLAQPDCPMEYRAMLEPLDAPARVAPGKPFALRVRAWNRGRSPWALQAESNAGFHACYALRDPEDVCIFVGRAGLFDAVVEPEKSIDLTLALPALRKPGRYRLTVDMLDEPHCVFHQTGAEPLELEFEVK